MLYCSIELNTHSHITGRCFKTPTRPCLVTDDDATQEAEPDDYDDQDELSYIQFF